MTIIGAQLHSAMPLPATERYEILRTAALGTPLPPESRSGLTILLHRGMWAWVQAIVRASGQCSSASVPPVGDLPIADKTSEQRTIISLLAAMVMAVPERRTA